MNDHWFDRVAAIASANAAGAERAPARLKSKVYSAVINRLANTGPLLDLVETRAGGRALCVFEHAVAILPVGTTVKAMNPCRVCHARVAGERMDHAPIFWPGCPYSEFHNG
jgi:hypothetical protein